MTDKEKIKVEVERLKESGCASHIVICDTLLAFIDSLQEEPVSIWHDKSEKPKRDDLLIETNDGRIIRRQSINNYGMVKRWAYTSDLLNLDNSCNFGKNLQEEPKNKCNGCNNVKGCVTCVDGSAWAHYEEPVSEELEEAAIMHYKDVMEYEAKTGLKPAYMTSFKAGANWQKQQMMENAMPCALGWYDGFVPEFTQEQLHNVIEKNGLDVGDKISVIILKQND